MKTDLLRIKNHQIEMDVCAAQLSRNGFVVISQRDCGSQEILCSKVDENHSINKQQIDHHDTAWFKSYLINKNQSLRLRPLMSMCIVKNG
ncbi:MAG: hypothetical protein PHO74_07405 [Weeksellaceae bacterium]|nr:hypothetical protein [Weeksellaceae bacterium]